MPKIKDIANSIMIRAGNALLRNSIAPVNYQIKKSRTTGYSGEPDYSSIGQLLGGSALSDLGVPNSNKVRTISEQARLYGQSVWVYACVYIIANSIAGVPLKLYKKNSKGEIREVIDNKNPICLLLDMPNPYMSIYDLIEATVAGMELTGNAYLEEVKNNSGILKEIYPLQPQRIKIIPGKNVPVRGYIYSVGGVDIPFDEDEITHIKYYNPVSDFYGMSPIVAAEISVNADIESGKWNERFFKNSARPDGVLETDGTLLDGTFNRLRENWNKAHKGTSKSHNIAILEGGLKYKQVSVTQKDMDFIGLKNQTREDILGVYGVPPAMLGIVESANYSNMESQKKQFWESTLLPKMRKIEAALNINIVNQYDRKYFVAFDLDSVEALKESMQTRAKIAALMVDRGIMTQNEVRANYFDLPPVPWGNRWHMPLNLTDADNPADGGGQGSGGDIPGRTPGRPSVDDENIDDDSSNKGLESLDDLLRRPVI